MNVLIDELSQPALRGVIGQLLGGATHADIAVSEFRVAMMDLTRTELAHVTGCRVLLDRLDAGRLSLLGSRRHDDERDALLEFIGSERVEIRSAGVGHWSPDFSIYRGVSTAGAPPQVCLVGPHYFGIPPAEPAFTCMLTDPRAVARALTRFESLWQQAHDVKPVVRELVSKRATARVEP